MRCSLRYTAFIFGACYASMLIAADVSLPLVGDVERQPLAAQVSRVAQALEMVGAPLPKEPDQQLDAILSQPDSADFAKKIQEVLDPLCLVGVNINPESRVKVAVGAARPQLIQQGWRVFLVKVHNEAGVTAPLRVTSPNAAKLQTRSGGDKVHRAPLTVKPADVIERWLDVQMLDSQPLNANLSGLKLEYRVIQLYSRDAGEREAKLAFDVGQGTQDLGFRNEVNILFKCEPAVALTLEVLDDDGTPTTAQFVFRDSLNRVYPAVSRRLAPDFFFHQQIYRSSGETVSLPPGKYRVSYTRGPEYVEQSREIEIPADAKTHKEAFRLKRWINLAKLGWFSGDHHIHAAGCAHYESPTEGVGPADMMRHIVGEDLNVGCVLSWGPCWYHQKEFFEGSTHKLSTPRHLMRYDVEVSGFPSSHAGHLCLLRLKEDDYPGTSTIEEWPSWCLPVLQWGKSQGGVVGFAHSGWGLQADATTLPNYVMPGFDGIGANEYIVDVTHGACDFISAVDTPILSELNIWYHTLNCGYECRISGETDFPCIYGERVGIGRAYVKLDATKPLDYDQWVAGIRDGRSYCCDGLSHLVDYRVNDLAVGEQTANGRASVLHVKSGEKLKVKLRAAARLAESPDEKLRNLPVNTPTAKTASGIKPYWHLERARIGDTRNVPVELVVNGQSVERRELTADGRLEEFSFDYTPTQSGWMAVRIFPSSHTNPIFIEVDDKPIRASRRSAQWCLDAVDVCWKSKSPKIRENERAAAEAAYEVARQAYRKILAESSVD
jgi:hypothetical protein